jgi:hypothetical protein
MRFESLAQGHLKAIGAGAVVFEKAKGDSSKLISHYLTADE